MRSQFERIGRVTAAALVVCFASSMRVSAQATNVGSMRIADVRQHFDHPPDDARIMVRWWWFGPAVDKAELRRELETMKQGGIGGVEVQPVYPLALDDSARGVRNVPYLSDAFLDNLRFASDTAKELGLRFDLTLGSGWPYGGPSVPVNEAAGMLRVKRVQVNGDVDVPLPSLAGGEKLLAVFFTPSGTSSSAQYQQITDIRDDQVHAPGAGEILFFVSSRTGMMVKRAAVGAEGFVVDHYDRTAVNHYLANVGDRLMQAFPTTRPYAIFCDSLEDYNSDWTPDFLQEFRRRRGYDLLPHLPAIASDRVPNASEIRHDWGQTLSELFNDRFATPLQEWAQRNHTRLRMQAYGIPPAELSSNALVDLPEGEGPQWQQLSATRWASSASHIYGVPVTSAETWTWLHSPVFRATPLDMKAEADRDFLIGINQLVGHGWPYSPPQVEYPGWRFYAAAVFDEKNPWWIVMPDVTRYMQRVSYVLRQGHPANDVAIYLPTDDAWSRFKPGRVNLFETLRDAVGHDVIAQVLAAGFDFDVFDDSALAHTGKIEGHQLALGQNRYRIVILPGVDQIPLATLTKLSEFATSGGILVATRRIPSRAPGLTAQTNDTQRVAQLARELFQSAGGKATLIENEQNLAGTLSKLLRPDVQLTPATPDMGFIHRKLGDADIYFIANTGNERRRVSASFRDSQRSAEWWDAVSGRMSPAELKGSELQLDLAPYESRIVVFSATGKRSAPTPRVSQASTIDLSSDWRVTIGGSTTTFRELHSWTEDTATKFFSGVATYEKMFHIPAATNTGIPVVLDFGDGAALEPHAVTAGMQAWLEPPIREAAVVYVNGKRAGSLWSPPYQLDISPFVHAGENTIRIEVANLALNFMAGRSLPDYRLLNSRYGVRFEAQDMNKVEPIPSGIIGHVSLRIGGVPER